ncbi:MAG: fibronectin type III domain-containing protein [Candidatus Micrarchaeota archaeon]|nr:fibronectin type III domain-containing protein [Candidatus Micrarchaeota archaeon]
MADPEIEKYVKENLAKGCTWEAIRLELRKAGWPEKEINEATPKAMQPAPEETVAKKAPSALPAKMFAAVVVGAVAVIAVYSAYLYFSQLSMQPSGGEIPFEPLPPAVSPPLPEMIEPTAVPTALSTLIPAFSTPAPTSAPTPPPVIPVIYSASNYSIKSDSAIISWITDVPSTTRIIYGTASLNQSIENGDQTTAHYVKLTGLAPNTTYNYAVASCVKSACRYSETNSFKTPSMWLDVEGIELSPLGQTIYVNDSMQFNAVVVLKNGTRTAAPPYIISWDSPGALVGSVNSTGFFQPASPGTATVNVSIVNATATNGTIVNLPVQAIWNSTTITVLKARPRLSISITPSDFVDYGTTTTITCQANTSQVTPALTRDGALLSGAADSAVLPVGSHSYSCYSNETTNYTSVFTYATVGVRKVTASPKLLVNGSEWTADTAWNISQGFYYANFSYSGTTAASTSSECSFNVFCTILNLGTFTFTVYHSGDENHTATSVVRYFNVIS